MASRILVLRPRMLVLSASAGSGHLRAAEAVELALKEVAPNAVVKNVDVLTLTNAAFRRVYGAAYLDLVNKAPHVLGYFYDRLDRPTSPQKKSDRLRYLVQRMNLGPLNDLLTGANGERWDAFVSTHFLPAEMIAALKRKKKVSAPQLLATTDFETHRLWVNEPCERYFTATEEGAAYLAHWGAARDAISVTGIPIHPVFREKKPRELCLSRQGLRGDRPIVVQLAGGFGVGPIEEILRGILAIERPLEVVVVAGKNDEAKKKLEKVAPGRHRLKVLGYTTSIDELMAVADVLVSKPGGLTTSEALARGAAMAIVNPIPGQESRNADYLLEQGVAIKINHVPTLPLKLGELLEDRKRLAGLQSRARKLGRPDAAFDVARAAVAACC
jgi:processive 1,2-diacylglycerol beta-glucosyltransferase